MSPEMESRRSGIAFHQSEDSFSLVWRLPPRAREGLPEPGLSWSLSRVSVLRWPPDPGGSLPEIRRQHPDSPEGGDGIHGLADSILAVKGKHRGGPGKPPNSPEMTSRKPAGYLFGPGQFASARK